MSRVWMDGRFLDAAEARVEIEDRGFRLGHGAFETLRWTDGGLRRWADHKARLEGGLAYLGVAPPLELDAAPRAAAELAAALGVSDGVVRLTVSAGPGGGGLEGRTGAAARMVLTLKPRPTPPASASVAILPEPRRAGTPGDAFKLSGYADLIAARREARAAGAERAVVTSARGGVLACADCANLFWIEGGRVFTPAVEAGALPGVTRSALLARAPDEGVVIEAVSAPPEALRRAEAAFMTNAVEGVVAIRSVDGVAKPVDHPVMEHLRRLEAGWGSDPLTLSR